MGEGEKYFTGQHAPQKGGDAEPGNAKEHEPQAQGQSGGVLEKGEARRPQAVQDAAGGGGQVEEGAEPGEDGDEISGSFVPEDADAQVVPEAREDADAENSHVKAVAQGQGDGGGDALPIARRLGLRHRGKEQHGHGVGDGGRKEDEGHGHAGEHAVEAVGLLGGEATCQEAVGDEDGLGAGEEI